MPGMVLDSTTLSKPRKRAFKIAQERKIYAVIQNHYTGADQYTDGTRRLLTYIPTCSTPGRGSSPGAPPPATPGFSRRLWRRFLFALPSRQLAPPLSGAGSPIVPGWP